MHQLLFITSLQSRHRTTQRKNSHRNQLNEATISLTSGFMWKLSDGAMLTRLTGFFDRTGNDGPNGGYFCP